MTVQCYTSNKELDEYLAMLKKRSESESVVCKYCSVRSKMRIGERCPICGALFGGE